MLFAVFPIVLIVVGLAIVIVIVVRKFPQLKVLDTETIPEEQDRKKKEKILEERFYRALKPVKAKSLALGKVWLDHFMRLQKRFRGYVNHVADTYRSERGKVKKKKFTQQSPRTRERELNRLLDEADELRDTKELVRAEEKYIAAIALSPKSIRAYKGLGKIYFSQEKFTDAKETFMYVTSLDKVDDVAHAFLGRIAKAEQRWEDAIKHYLKALSLNADLAKRHVDLAQVYHAIGDQVEKAKKAYQHAYSLESKNPAVLDQIIEFAISIKDKVFAREILKQLQEVNPENKKLADFKERIRNLKK